MNINIDKIDIKGDRVLVKRLQYEDKIGSFYVPDSVRARKEKRRGDAWKAEVCCVGDNVDFDVLKGTLGKGDIIYCSPVSLDCPSFEDENGNKLIIVTQEDIIAKEIK